MSQQYPNRINPVEEEINLREELEKYLRYWPWFVASTIVCIIVAFAYLKLSIPVYSTTASIIIEDEDSKTPSSELAAFSDLGILDGLGTNSIENEMGILRSKRMMNNAVNALNINVQYYNPAEIRTPEVYEDLPFQVEVIQIDEKTLSRLAEDEENLFDFTLQGNKFVIEKDSGGKVSRGRFGKPIKLEFGQVIVTKNPDFDKESFGEFDNLLKVKFSPVENVVLNYRENLQVLLVDDNSTLIELKLEDHLKKKSEDILDQLIIEYNKEAILDKNLVARNTAKFIDERLKIINNELDSVEGGKEEFKEENKLTDIQTESELFIENASDYKKRQQELGTQLELVKAMISYLENDTDNDLLPANLGIEEESVNNQIEEFNDLVLERNRILSGSTEKNPVIIKLNARISEIRKNVLVSLQRLQANLRIAQEDLNGEMASIGSEILSIPSKEREFRGIERQQNIKEALYLFLLQKREENSLSLAVTAPKAKIVDSAYSSNEPVSPKPKIILLAALILGMLIPFVIIYLKNLLNNKVKSRADLEKASKEIPVVGEVPRIAKSEKEIIESTHDRSVLAEAFRILHTNLQYLLVKKGDKKTGIKIFITSTVKGEGKTFTAFNLAMTLANTNKKVVIVGGDLRNPQLQRYEADTREMLGVSNYLVGKSELNGLINKSALHDNLYLLPSGSIPPNPAELWRLEKADELFARLESEFDYVIVDTAPSMLVADTFLINKYADLTLYMVRAGYTEKKLQEFALDAKRDGKLHDVGFVLNDVELANFGYGNKYGYTYGAEEVGFWKKLREKAAIW